MSLRCVADAMLGGVLFLGSLAAPAQGRPNVVLVLLDNFGYGEVGAYGGGIRRGAPTPRIDSLARDGLKLTNFNTEPACTPSRSALMTGRFAIRSGTHVMANHRDGGLVQWEITLAEMLHEAGYVSAHLGKWHLGNRPGRYPIDQGFDEWYGITRSSEQSLLANSPSYDSKLAPPHHVVEGRKGGPSRELAAYDLDMRSRFDGEVTRRAIEFIRLQAKSGQPFFAYLPLTTGHYPTIPSPEWKGKTGHGSWADVLAQLDHYVGQLLDVVKEAGVEQNTIFIFTADNGAQYWEAGKSASRGWAGPWRGSYFTAMEGGLRVPFLIRWPGKIPSGSESDEIVHLVDILPTLARVTGARVPTDRVIDGVDQWDFITGKQKKSNREFFPIYAAGSGLLLAVKWRNWKLHYYEKVFTTDPVTQGLPQLVNLHTNPLEERNVGIEDQDVWVLLPIAEKVEEFQTSLTRHPPIRPNAPDPYLPPVPQ